MDILYEQGNGTSGDEGKASSFFNILSAGLLSTAFVLYILGGGGPEDGSILGNYLDNKEKKKQIESISEEDKTIVNVPNEDALIEYMSKAPEGYGVSYVTKRSDGSYDLVLQKLEKPKQKIKDK